jgi:hypothetical protein
MDWKEARSDMQFIAGVEIGTFAARAFRIRGVTVVAWKEGTTRVLCRLTESEEHEAQEAIRRGDGERVATICKGAERITLTIKYERQTLEWKEATSEAEEGTRKEIAEEETSEEKRQRLENEWTKALNREELRRGGADETRMERAARKPSDRRGRVQAILRGGSGEVVPEKMSERDDEEDCESREIRTNDRGPESSHETSNQLEGSK